MEWKNIEVEGPQQNDFYLCFFSGGGMDVLFWDEEENRAALDWTDVLYWGELPKAPY